MQIKYHNIIEGMTRRFVRSILSATADRKRDIFFYNL